MKIETAQRLGKVEEYYFSQKLRAIAQMRATGKDVINLGIGSPDLPAAPEVIAELAVVSQLPHAHGYQSYQGILELRAAFADWYATYFGVELNASNEILPLIGSKEGIMHLSMAYLEKGDKVLVPNPGYPTYSAAASLAGATVLSYDLLVENNWQPDWTYLEQLDLSKVKLMWINYPNMPTGADASQELFEKAVAFGKKHHILICNDNPYAFILRDQPKSLLSVAGAKEVGVELNSLSKSQNMAGWRVGMVASNAEVIANILRFKSNMDSGMFLALQHASVKALQLPRTWYTDLNDIYRERQRFAFEIMQILGCSFDNTQGGMFVWAKVPNIYKNGFELTDVLLEKAHVFITPGGIFGSNGNHYIRISLCSDVAILQNASKRIKQLF